MDGVPPPLKGPAAATERARDSRREAPSDDARRFLALQVFTRPRRDKRKYSYRAVTRAAQVDARQIRAQGGTETRGQRKIGRVSLRPAPPTGYCAFFGVSGRRTSSGFSATRGGFPLAS